MSVAINRKKKWIQAAVIIALMVLVGFIPPVEPLTADGMRVLGILIGCIYAWSIGELIWPSILSLILLGFMGENTVTGIFSSAYGNQNVLMVLFCMIMCYGIEQSGLLQVITKWILSKRFAQKGPWWLCFAFCIASAVAAIVTCASIPVAVLCWAIFYDVCDTMNLERKESICNGCYGKHCYSIIFRWYCYAICRIFTSLFWPFKKLSSRHNNKFCAI